jgi:hypothetical protein
LLANKTTTSSAIFQSIHPTFIPFEGFVRVSVTVKVFFKKKILKKYFFIP